MAIIELVHTKLINNVGKSPLSKKCNYLNQIQFRCMVCWTGYPALTK